MQFNFLGKSHLLSRSFRNGDENTIIALWDSVYSQFGGYIPKTVEYWKWCVLDRPGINNEDIIIIEDSECIVGYAVSEQNTSGKGNTGIILEFAISRLFSSSKRKRYAKKLIEEIEKRSRERGDELLNMTIPSADKDIVSVLQRSGYSAEAVDAFQLIIVDLVVLLQQILTQRNKQGLVNIRGSFIFNLEPGYYRFCHDKSVRIDLNSEPIVEASSIGADFMIKTDLSTITDIIFKRKNIDTVMRDNKVLIESNKENAELAVCQFFQLLEIQSEWYLPTIDGR